MMGVDTPNWEALSAGLRPEEGRRVKHRKETRRNRDTGGRKWRRRRSISNTVRKFCGLFVFFTEAVGEITEWTIGLSAVHVIPNMLSDKNGVRALQSTPSEASEDAIARVCAFLCVWPSS